MAQSGNYAAQAERELLSVAAQKEADPGFAHDVAIVEDMVRLSRRAVHFAIPANAEIFDDELRGMRGLEARLPFKEITIEFPVTKTDTVSKCVVYAAEHTSEHMAAHFKNSNVDFSHSATWIIAFAAVYVCGGPGWRPQYVGASMPCETWDSGGANTEIRAHILPLTGTMNYVRKRLGHDEAEKIADLHCASITQAILELCEALSCSNVSHEPIEKINQSVNARRVRDGKLPIYETRCLVINSPGKAPASSLRNGGAHASPRQHLRRGHIRRLANKNIWVNSCVVAASNPAKIEKSYFLGAH